MIDRDRSASNGDASEPAPIFVIGSMRSGASVLATALGHVPNLVQIDGTGWFEVFARGLQQAYSAGTARRSSSLLDVNGIELDAFFAYFGAAINQLVLSGYVSPADSGLNARLIPGRAYRPKRWVDATPENTFNVYGLLRLFPKAKFIHIVRKVDEVVESMVDGKNREEYRSLFFQIKEREAYVHWLESVTAGLRAETAFGSETVLRVRRDDLIHEPEATLRRCLDFVGEPFDTASMWAFHSVNPEATTSRPREGITTGNGPEDWKLEAEFLSTALLDEPAPTNHRNEALIFEIGTAASRRWANGFSLVPEIPGPTRKVMLTELLAVEIEEAEKAPSKASAAPKRDTESRVRRFLKQQRGVH